MKDTVWFDTKLIQHLLITMDTGHKLQMSEMKIYCEPRRYLTVGDTEKISLSMHKLRRNKEK